MLSLPKRIDEKIKINKDYSEEENYSVAPESLFELIKIIEDRINKQGPGTEKNPIDLNDIDVRKIENLHGVFNYINNKIVAVDVSDWDVSNAKALNSLFLGCKFLKYVGDLSGWNVENVNDMHFMFSGCSRLRSIGNLSYWDVRNVTNFNSMFKGCEKLKDPNIDGWRVNSSLTKNDAKLIISGTTGWKMPSWVKGLPVK